MISKTHGLLLNSDNGTPSLWVQTTQAFRSTTSPFVAMFTSQDKNKVQSELELSETLEASWERRTRGRLPSSAGSVKGRGGNLRRELIALQHCLQVHQSPCKLKARWGSGFTGPIWHQTHITLRWGHHPYWEDALGTLIPPTSASRRGPHYLRQQKEEPLCAISTILYILNSATFSTKVHFN